MKYDVLKRKAGRRKCSQVDYLTGKKSVGEIHAIISNVGNTVYEIKADDKIGQLIILPIVIPDFTFENWKERGTGAFGSTGR